MRGRGGRSSLSSGTREQSRMALRRQPIRNVSSESQCLDEDTEEDEAAAERDNGEELSSLLLTTRREKRWTERENESKPKEMTEEEMMDLALHMSKQEASVTALRRQEEEEAVMKAIQESMVGETQPSPTLLADSSLGSRRKLSYPNRNAQPAVDDEALEDSCLSETHLNSADRAGDGKRKAGSPLQQMPDSQASPNRLESSSVRLDSPQSSDSILIKDSQFQKSPVFPRTICRAAVHVDRLDQHLVETCRNSGFVLCSQDSWTSSQKSAQSPTFPRSSLPSRPKSPIVIDLDQEGNAEAELSAQFAKSPVFGRNTQKERLPSARKHQTQCVFSSQESLTPSAKSASCWPNSPVFPKSPGAASELPPSGQLGLPDSPDRGQIEPCRDRSMSPVFGLTSQQRVCPDVRTSVGLDITGKDTKCDGLNAVMRFPQSEELDENPRDWNSAEPELTSDMTLVWSDEDDAAPVGFPSPVFPGEQPVHQAEIQPALRNHTAATERSHRLNPGMSGTVGDLTSSGTSTRRTQEAAQEAAGMASAGQAVHYYWGVPFCPRGLDPDTYTQVIMAQMEVYEKSLKRAQRCLLRKAEWGEAILPQPEKSPSPEVPAGSPQHYVPRRRGLRLRGRETKKAAGSQPAEAEEGEREDEEQLQQQMEKDEGDEEQMKTDDCEVCPETPLKDEGTQDLMMDIQTEAEPPCKSSERPEIEMILPEDSPAGEEPQEEEDASVDERMEINVDPGGQSQEEKGPGPESRNPVQQLFQPVTKAAEFNEHRSPASWNIHLWGPDMNDVQDEGPPRSSSPEPEPAIVPQSPKVSVDCPICQTSFPVSEIEMHAAYCDGEVAVVDERGPESNRFQESLKPRRKRFRKMEETNRAWSAGRNQEKCYICQKAVSLRDYGRHTDLCLQRQPTKSTAAAGTSHRYKPTAVSFQRGNLLSALEQADNRKSDAGPSGSRVQPEDVIDLRDDDDDDEEASAFRISNSPIRAFTPISEATDCLIDFKKQQQTKKPSQRRR